MDKENSKILTPTEAAAQLRVSTRTLEGQRQRGDGPPYIQITRKRIGYFSTDIEAWAVDHVRRSTSEAA